MRSETSLIQTIGRAARNIDGKVLMYADTITKSMKKAIDETDRRRDKQKKYNVENSITPKTIEKNVNDILEGLYKGDTDQARVTADLEKTPGIGHNLSSHLEDLKSQMLRAAENLEFEEAAKLRDEIKFAEDEYNESNQD